MSDQDIIGHTFTVRRQDGIGPHPDHWPCSTCGKPKSGHKPACPGSLTIKGEHFGCDLTPPHDGWAHSNSSVEAIWL